MKALKQSTYLNMAACYIKREMYEKAVTSGGHVAFLRSSRTDVQNQMLKFDVFDDLGNFDQSYENKIVPSVK